MTYIHWVITRTWGTLILGVVAVVLVAALAVRSPALGAAVIGVVALFLAMWKHPRVALTIWLLTFAFVPPWLGVSLSFYLPATTLVGVLVLITSVGSPGWRLRRADLVIVGLIVVAGLGVTLDSSSSGVWASTVTQWLLSYLAGKAIISRTGTAFAGKAIVVIFAIVAVLAIVELVAHWHPFAAIDLGNGGEYEIWSPIQQRGGLDRSEWAFGHSIALAGALSMSIPFILASNLRGGRKALVLLLVLGGIVTTFSRGGLLAAAVGVLIMLLFQSTVPAKQKALFTALIVAGGLILTPTVSSVFDTAGTEASASSGYRLDLLALIPTMQAIGRSSSAIVGPTGAVSYSRFGSIDNAFLQIGLEFGWIAMLLMLLPFAVLIVRILRKRATTADVALLSQLPMLATVAMITQWQSLVWLLAGFAVVYVRTTAEPATLPARGLRDERLRWAART